jgi:hypothetical protein
MPNVNKIPIPDGCKIDQMSIKYNNIFHCNSLQKIPKFGFLVCKYAIWQPCSATDSECDMYAYACMYVVRTNAYLCRTRKFPIV